MNTEAVRSDNDVYGDFINELAPGLQDFGCGFY